METKNNMTLRAAAVVAAGAATLCIGSVAYASPAQPNSAQATRPTAEQKKDANAELDQYSRNADRSYWTMAAGNNCTNYVAWRLIQEGMPKNVDWLHNASEWAQDAKQHNIPVNKTPAVGAVAQWNANSPGSYSGHVAIVEATGPGWILISEDNYASGPRKIEIIHQGTSRWPSNFIHFNTAPTTPKAATPNVAWQHFLRSYAVRW